MNPKHLLVTSFAQTDPSGYGLMQRTRDFNRYEDLTTPYEAHPSAWVEPDGKWGEGRIELVEIPSPDETNDNISAFWVSKDPVSRHRLHAALAEKRRNASAVGVGYADAERTRFSGEAGWRHGFRDRFHRTDVRRRRRRARSKRRFPAMPMPTIVEQKAVANPEIDGWRVLLRVKAERRQEIHRVARGAAARRAVERNVELCDPAGMSAHA